MKKKHKIFIAFFLLLDIISIILVCADIRFDPWASKTSKNDSEETVLLKDAEKQPSEWAISYVERAQKKGITDKKAKYDYQTSITREQFCELVYNLIKEDYPNPSLSMSGEYDGIALEDTDNKAVINLVLLEVIDGIDFKYDYIPNTAPGKEDTSLKYKTITFAPDSFLTREEAATILSRVIALYPNVCYTEKETIYADKERIAGWAKIPVQTISNLGIMNGVGGGNFAPKSRYTVEQAIITVVRTYDIISKYPN